MVVATIFSFKHFLYALLTTGVATVAIATNHHSPQKARLYWLLAAYFVSKTVRKRQLPPQVWRHKATKAYGFKLKTLQNYENVS
jgi:hypothetical protein